MTTDPTRCQHPKPGLTLEKCDVKWLTFDNRTFSLNKTTIIIRKQDGRASLVFRKGTHVNTDRYLPQTSFPYKWIGSYWPLLSGYHDRISCSHQYVGGKSLKQAAAVPYHAGLHPDSYFIIMLPCLIDITQTNTTPCNNNNNNSNTVVAENRS